MYLWRVVDRVGEILDILVHSKRNNNRGKPGIPHGSPVHDPHFKGHISGGGMGSMGKLSPRSASQPGYIKAEIALRD